MEIIKINFKFRNHKVQISHSKIRRKDIQRDQPNMIPTKRIKKRK